MRPQRKVLGLDRVTQWDHFSLSLLSLLSTSLGTFQQPFSSSSFSYLLLLSSGVIMIMFVTSALSGPILLILSGF